MHTHHDKTQASFEATNSTSSRNPIMVMPEPQTPEHQQSNAKNAACEPINEDVAEEIVAEQMEIDKPEGATDAWA